MGGGSGLSRGVAPVFCPQSGSKRGGKRVNGHASGRPARLMAAATTNREHRSQPCGHREGTYLSTYALAHMRQNC